MINWSDCCFVFLFISCGEPTKDINNLRMAARHVAMVKEIADRVLLSSGRSLKCDPSSVKTTSVNCAHLSTPTLWYIEAIPSGQWKEICARIWLTGQSKNSCTFCGRHFRIPCFFYKVGTFHHCKTNCSKIEIFSKRSFKRSMIFMKV